jgi:hypothetical protein
MVASIADQALAALGPLDGYAHDCHRASLRLVAARVFEGGRVARGTARSVGGQHSWVVIGDPYDPDVVVVDATLWSYDESVERVYVGRASDWPHRPHGYGSIWQAGRPHEAVGPPVVLTPKTPLSRQAADFVELLGPLDADGWGVLANLPVGGWPAAEIIAAMDDTEEVSARVPIDRLGMLTDRNPAGLFLPTEHWRL